MTSKVIGEYNGKSVVGVELTFTLFHEPCYEIEYATGKVEKVHLYTFFRKLNPKFVDATNAFRNVPNVPTLLHYEEVCTVRLA